MYNHPKSHLYCTQILFQFLEAEETIYSKPAHYMNTAYHLEIISHTFLYSFTNHYGSVVITPASHFGGFIFEITAQRLAILYKKFVDMVP